MVIWRRFLYSSFLVCISFIVAGTVSALPSRNYSAVTLSATSVPQGTTEPITVQGAFFQLYSSNPCGPGTPEGTTPQFHYPNNILNIYYRVLDSNGNDTGIGRSLVFNADWALSVEGVYVFCGEPFENGYQNSHNYYNFVGSAFKIDVRNLAPGDYYINFTGENTNCNQKAFPDTCNSEGFSDDPNELQFTITAGATPTPTSATINVNSNINSSWTIDGPGENNFTASNVMTSSDTGPAGDYVITPGDLPCYDLVMTPNNATRGVLAGGEITWSLEYTAHQRGGCAPVSPPGNFSAWSSCFGWPSPMIETNLNPSSGADSYTLERSVDGGGWGAYQSGLSYQQLDNYSDSSISPNSNYNYRVRAVNSGGSTLSSETGGIVVNSANCGGVNPVCAATHYNCSAGTAINGSESSTAWSWLCRASGGDASCTEQKPLPVGVCAATHYNCSAGTAINGSDNPTTWTWLCRDSGGDDSCTETKPPVCAATHFNCSVGTAINGSETSTTWTWLCRNSAGDSSCSELKPTCQEAGANNIGQPLPCTFTPTVDFDFSPNDIDYYGYTTATWSSTNATSCAFSWPILPPTLNGSGQYGPLEGTSTVTLTCTGPGGTASDTDTVTVGPAPVMNYFQCNGVNTNGTCTIPYNGTAGITWSSSNTTMCGLVSSLDPSTSVPVASTGTRNDTGITANRDYSIECWNGATGVHAPALPMPLHVVVSGPTADIKANSSDGPITVAWNGSATISWTSTNAASCTVSPNGWTGTSGSQSTGALPIPGGHTYTATCSGNGSGTDSVTVNVSNPVPTAYSATYSGPDYCQVGPGGYIAWSYSDPSGSPQVSYQIQIDDQGSFQNNEYDSGQLNSSSKVFTIPNGVLQFNKGYKARVRVWNTYGSVSSWTETSTFNTPNYAYPDVEPPYQFTWPTEPRPQQNKAVQFTDRTAFGGGNVNNRSWSWNFGDGTTSTQQSPAHTFTTIGNFTITQTVTDAANQTCSYSQSINIQKPIPVIKEVAPK